MPTEPGEYKLVLTEIQAPEGYDKLEEPVELNIRFEKDSSGSIIVSTVSEDEDKNVTTSKVTKQLIGLNVGNNVDESVKEGEYG